MGSFRRVFCEQQLEALEKTGDKYGGIKWCLHLKLISSGAYALQLRLLVLPSERTLSDYTHVLERGVGFLLDLTAQLVKEADTHIHESSAYVGRNEDKRSRI